MGNSHALRRWAALLLAVAGLASAAECQVIYGQPASGRASLVYTSWDLDSTGAGTTSIAQSLLIVSGFLPLRDNLEARFFLPTAAGDLESPEAAADVSGLGDLRLQVSRSLSNDQILLSIGLSLPTGKKELRFADERMIVQVLSENFLDFPVRRFGEGLGLNALAGFARNYGRATVAGGVSYSYTGAYSPYEGIDDYNPGDVLSANLGADLKAGRAVWSAAATLSYRTTDTREGAKMFRQSTDLDFRLANQTQLDRLSLLLLTRYLLRGESALYDQYEESLNRRLYGNEFHLSGRARYAVSEGWGLGPAAGLRLIAADDEFGASTVVRLGVEASRKIAAHGSLDVDLRYLTGSADGGAIDLSGWQASVSLQAAM